MWKGLEYFVNFAQQMNDGQIVFVKASLNWESCEEYSVDKCTLGTGSQRYLGCYVSLWRTCANQVLIILSNVVI